MLRKALPLISSVALLLMVPALSHAQQASGIAGAVRDTSGAVLPGVTVEAASPALIEKVRVGRHRRRRPLQHRRSSSRHVHGDVFAARVHRLPTRRDRADRRVHGDGERRHAGRRRRGDDHGDGRDAARRHAERAPADRRLRRNARHAADEHEAGELPRRADARPLGHCRRRRHLLDAGRRRNVSRQGRRPDAVRRHERPEHDRQHRLHAQRRAGAGDDAAVDAGSRRKGTPKACSST